MFDKYPFKKIKKVYSNLICKVNNKLCYIKRVYKKDGIIYFDVIFEDLSENIVLAKMFVKYIRPLDFKIENYLDFINKLKEKGYKEFCVYG